MGRTEEKQPFFLINNTEEVNIYKTRSFWNVLVLGLGFCIVFAAYTTTQNLLTSILQGSLGFISLAVLYACLGIANFIAPPLLAAFGPRLCMVLGAVPYALFVASVIKPYPPAVLVASVLVGVGAAVLWTSQSDYLVRCTHGDKTKLGIFNGVFYSLFQASGVAGNAISAALTAENVPAWINFTVQTVVCLLGVVVLMFLGKEEPIVDDDVLIEQVTNDKGMKKFLKGVWETVLLFTDEAFLLLLPFTFFSGFSQSYYYGVMTKRINDSQGTQWVPMAMIVYFSAEVVGSLFFGKLSDAFGRRLAVWLTFALEGIAFIMLFFLDWVPFYFFAVVLVAGLADSGNNTQIYSVYGSVFTSKLSVSFAGLKFVQSLALSVGLVCGAFNVNNIIYLELLLGLLMLSGMMFAILDFKVRPGVLGRPKNQHEAL